MPTITLTDKAIKAFKPTPGKRLEYFDAKVPGLALRITETGHKSWSLHYRTTAARLRRLTLGDYSTVGLAKARKKATAALRAADHGDDPAAEKKAARIGETVGDLAKEYLELYAKKHKKSWRDDDRMLNAEVLPAWRTRKVRELTRRDVRDLVEAIAERGSPISANRCLALIRKMLNFAIQRDWIDANPASLIQKPGTEQSRARVLTDDEIRLVWDACTSERSAMGALMRLRLVTAQRGGELAQLKWTDIDGDWLTIPETVTKNKQPHRVPLTKKAIEILGTVPKLSDTWVFAGRFSDTPGGDKPLGDSKHAGRRVAKRVLVELQKQDPTVKTFDFRGHDLRRTASTRMAEAGISQADIAKVLNHAEGGPRATHVYNRYAYDREKRIALETWERVLIAILTPKKKATAGDVVPITTRETRRRRA